MNNVKVKELEQLNSDYYAGSIKDILYKCCLLGPFIISTANSQYRNEKEVEIIYNSYINWLNICDEYNLSLVDSLIELYKYNKIRSIDKEIEFYNKYYPVIDLMTDFLLGKIDWQPSTQEHLTAVNYSSNLTAEVLKDIYTYS